MRIAGSGAWPVGTDIATSPVICGCLVRRRRLSAVGILRAGWVDHQYDMYVCCS